MNHQATAGMAESSLANGEACRIEYSVVIPAYNSTKSLPELHARLAKTFETKLDCPNFEIIFVDDASPNPETWPTLKQVAKEDPRVRALQLLKNSGQQNATMCGLQAASGDRIVIMDDDLQHLPEEIPAMVRALENDDQLDVIIAVPYNRNHAASRNLSSYAFNMVMGVLVHKPKNLRYASFILLTRTVRNALVKYKGHKITTCSLITMNTRRVANLHVKSAPRKYGTSNYSWKQLAALAFNHAFNFSSLPLQFISVMGMVISLLSVLYGAFIVFQRLAGTIEQPGFATIVALISLYSGVLLLSLGVMGQYMVRILRATTYGHQYAVRCALGFCSAVPSEERTATRNGYEAEK